MHFQRKHTNIKSNALRSFVSFIVELKGVRLIRGLPRGVSSLVECTVVGADVAAVRAYSVVSMVRLGMISCTYLL